MSILSGTSKPNKNSNNSSETSSSSCYDIDKSSTTTMTISGLFSRRRHTTLTFMMGLLIGYVIGGAGWYRHHNNNGSNHFQNSATATLKTTFHSSSTVQHFDDIPIRSTSHVDPVTGKSILKQQFIDPFVVTPNLAGISIATIQQGQTISSHSHKTMHEFFYVLKGSGIFQIGPDSNNKNYTVRPGSFIHLSPPDQHAIFVPRNVINGEQQHQNNLVMLLVGITTD
jgi:quercetin dioxygenase-like cupin family protein